VEPLGSGLNEALRILSEDATLEGKPFHFRAVVEGILGRAKEAFLMNRREYLKYFGLLLSGLAVGTGNISAYYHFKHDQEKKREKNVKWHLVIEKIGADD